MQCRVMAVWEAGGKKKRELWEERDGVIKEAAAACNLCDVSEDSLRGREGFWSVC